MNKTIIASISIRIAVSLSVFLLLYIKFDLAEQSFVWFLPILIYAAFSYFVMIYRILLGTGSSVIMSALLAVLFTGLIITAVPYVISIIFPSGAEDMVQTICLGVVAFGPVMWDILRVRMNYKLVD